MKRYDERMIRLLLDRYERSLLFEGKNRRTIHIIEKLTRENFPEYFDESSIEFEEIHRQLEELEAKKIVTLYWKGNKQGHILERCILNGEELAKAYALVHRIPREEKKQKVREILKHYEKQLTGFTSYALHRMDEGKSVRKYIDEENPVKLERTLKLASSILTNEKEQYLRSFSIDVFHDSKLAEAELNLACSIIARFERQDLPQDLETDEILEEFNIFRNPTCLFLKGTGLPWEEQDGLQEGLGVFQGDLPALRRRLARQSMVPDVILTIENLTSYHQWKPGRHILGERELVIYLAGYANHVKCDFLRQLHELFPDAAFWHFGDIDCGGFRIWKNLCLSTGIGIQPFCMDISTWEACKKQGKTLSEGDQKTLAVMEKDVFFVGQVPLFRKMLEEKIKIEQECISPVRG